MMQSLKNIKDVLFSSQFALLFRSILLEEITMKMHEHTDQVITAHLRRRWGRTSIMLTAIGEKYNPIEMSTDDNETEDYLREKIFAAHKSVLKYKRKFNKNLITIYIRSE